MKTSLMLIVFIFLITISFKNYSQVTQGKKPGTTISKKATNNKKKSQNSTSEKAVVAQDPTPPPRTNTTVQTYNPPPRTKRTYSVGTGAYNQGDKMLNLGVGLSSYYYGNPIGLSYESGINENISVGVQLDYNSGSTDDYYYSSRNRWGYSAYYLGARGSYHLNRILGIRDKDVDLYTGIGLGYRRFKWDDDYGYGYGYGYSYNSGLFFNYFIGGKYYFTEKLGGFVELGYTGISSSRVGLSLKF